MEKRTEPMPEKKRARERPFHPKKTNFFRNLPAPIWK
jgi:hypothetical protein